MELRRSFMGFLLCFWSDFFFFVCMYGVIRVGISIVGSVHAWRELYFCIFGEAANVVLFFIKHPCHRTLSAAGKYYSIELS